MTPGFTARSIATMTSTLILLRSLLPNSGWPQNRPTKTTSEKPRTGTL